MEFRNELSLNAPLSSVWPALTDIESIAPCIPGFQLDSVDGDEYRGVMKVRVGAVIVSYKTVIRFAELDAEAFRAVLSAEGSEVRGHGSVGATVTSSLSEDNARTTVVIDTDLHVTGRVAQMGRGVLVEVSNKLLGQFAACLEQRLASSGAGAQAAGGGPEAPAPADRSTEAAEPVNLLALGAGPLLRRASPAHWLGALLARLRGRKGAR
jgi:carbon monoxide dehydrogenase subunit G